MTIDINGHRCSWRQYRLLGDASIRYGHGREAARRLASGEVSSLAVQFAEDSTKSPRLR